MSRSTANVAVPGPHTPVRLRSPRKASPQAPVQSPAKRVQGAASVQVASPRRSAHAPSRQDDERTSWSLKIAQPVDSDWVVPLAETLKTAQPRDPTAARQRTPRLSPRVRHQQRVDTAVAQCKCEVAAMRVMVNEARLARALRDPRGFLDQVKRVANAYTTYRGVLTHQLAEPLQAIDTGEDNVTAEKASLRWSLEVLLASEDVNLQGLGDEDQVSALKHALLALGTDFSEGLGKTIHARCESLRRLAQLALYEQLKDAQALRELEAMREPRPAAGGFAAKTLG